MSTCRRPIDMSRSLAVQRTGTNPSYPVTGDRQPSCPPGHREASLRGGNMKGSIAGLFVVASLVAAGHVCAQEIAPAPGRLEVSVIPGGGTWFLDDDDAPGFGNYDAGAAAAYNFSRI